MIELLKSRKGDMRKFDGKDPVNWILQMEKYFDLHGVPLLQKVCIASNYLELNQFLWYKGLCSRKPLVTSIFMEEMITHYEDTKRNTFFSQLITLKQKGSMEKHTEDFQKLNIRLNDIIEKQKINSIIYAMDADINGMKSYCKKSMEDLKKYMEGLKEGGTKLLQERPHNDKKDQETSKEEIYTGNQP